MTKSKKEAKSKLNKVNCPYCRKKKPHSHKGCNEVSTRTIQIN